MTTPCAQRESLRVSRTNLQALLASHIPATFLPDPCRTCEEECDGVHHTLPENAPHQHVVDSSLRQRKRAEAFSLAGTARDDWPRSVTEVDGLASALSAALSQRDESPKNPPLRHHFSIKQPADLPAGVFPSAIEEQIVSSSTTTILNGSNWPLERGTSSVLVFPDYKIIHNIALPDAATLASSLQPQRNCFDTPIVPSKSRSFVLPYRATLLICSHKTRDKKCSIAAPLLIAELKRAIEDEGWTVDEHGDEDSESYSSLETWHDDPETKWKRYNQELRNASQSDTIGIFKCSHIGGHRYAGNVIVCLPGGSNVWYGRVTPRECEAIVKMTIKRGQVIQELLRGGVGLAKGASLLQW